MTSHQFQLMRTASGGILGERSSCMMHILTSWSVVLVVEAAYPNTKSNISLSFLIVSSFTVKRSFIIETWTMWKSCSLILLITLRMYRQYAVTGACLCTTRTNGSVPSCAAFSGMDQPCHPNWKCNDRKVYVMSASCWACPFQKCLQKHEGLVSGTSLPNSVHYYDSGYMAYLGLAVRLISARVLEKAVSRTFLIDLGAVHIRCLLPLPCLYWQITNQLMYTQVYSGTLICDITDLKADGSGKEEEQQSYSGTVRHNHT